MLHDDLIDRIFENGVKYDILRLVFETRRIIQGTGWIIETDRGRGYRLFWADKNVPDDQPDVLDAIRFVAEDQRAVRADVAMLADDLRQALSAIVTLPPHVLVPSSVWTLEVDDAIMKTKGITGKLGVIAADIEIDASAVMSRYRALKAIR